jgi:hypothetical protein
MFLGVQLVMGYGTESADLRGWLSIAGSLLTAAAVLLFLTRKGDREGARRPLLPGILVVVAFLLSVGLAGYGFSSGGGVEAMLAPGPLEGEARLTLVLRPEEGRFAGGDAVAMVARLRALGAEVEAEVEGGEASPSAITLRFAAVRGREEALRALQPRILGLHLTHPDDQVSGPEGSAPRTVGSFEGRYSDGLQGPCPALQAWVEAAAPREDGACRWTTGPRGNGEQGRCLALCVRPASITAEDIEEASIQQDAMTNQPYVAFTLTSAGSERMRALTRENLRRTLAIVVDDEVLSAPIIMSEIGSHVQISLGDMDPDALLLEAQSIAAALRPGQRIRTPWVLAEERR